MYLSEVFNTIGLCINVCGSLLLVFSAPPILSVNKNGDFLLGLTGGSPLDTQRAENKRKYEKNWWKSKAGIWFLLVGFGFQLFGTIYKWFSFTSFGH